MHIETCSVCRSSLWDRKKDRNWTGLDQLGLDQWSIYGPVFFGPVASCPVFKNIIGPMKNRFKSVSTGILWKHALDHFHTYFHQFPSLDHQKRLRIGQDMTKISFVQVFCCNQNDFDYIAYNLCNKNVGHTWILS